MSTWQPTAAIETLKARAQITHKIRSFFAHRQVLEVETPTLCAATVTDLHLTSFVTEFNDPASPQNRRLYLQTSPEYSMKRLLCAGSGAIYQICKAFRDEEAGRMHNPEFTMLEWYRPGFDHFDLMQELAELIVLILSCAEPERISYQQGFQQFLGVDPLSVELSELRRIACDSGFVEIAQREEDKDTLLQLLFVEKIEPQIGIHRPCFIYGFPASQSALARLNERDTRVADRFELYYKGVELANGFYELADPAEQKSRFESDNKKRLAAGLAQQPIDEKLLSALGQGLPDCAGVALGLDRLIMLALGLDSIEQSMAFAVGNA